MDDYDISGLRDDIYTIPPEAIAEINGPFSESLCSEMKLARDRYPQSNERDEASVLLFLKYNPTLNEAKFREYVNRCTFKDGSDWFVWASLGAVAIGLVAYVATRK